MGYEVPPMYKQAWYFSVLPSIPRKCSRQPGGPCVDEADEVIANSYLFIKCDGGKYTGGNLGFLRIIFVNNLPAGYFYPPGH